MVLTAGTDSPPDDRLGRAIGAFERVVVLALLALMMLVVGLSAVELGWIVVEDLIAPPRFLLDGDELLEIFGFFLLVLIGIELLETMRAYLRDHAVHLEIVLEVALIAVARKAIVLDLEKHEGLSLLAVAALIAALSGARAIEQRLRRGDR